MSNATARPVQLILDLRETRPTLRSGGDARRPLGSETREGADG